MSLDFTLALLTGKISKIDLSYPNGKKAFLKIDLKSERKIKNKVIVNYNKVGFWGEQAEVLYKTYSQLNHKETYNLFVWCKDFGTHSFNDIYYHRFEGNLYKLYPSDSKINNIVEGMLKKGTLDLNKIF